MVIFIFAQMINAPRVLRPFCATAFLLLHTISVDAATINGQVISIADGDTITILDATHGQHKVRLSGIDAPEKKQAFGQRSKQSLADLAFNQRVTVEWSKRDRYGRIVGKVLLPSGVDANLQQIKRGMAWHYKQDEREQPPEDRETYAAAEKDAREARVGLWQDAQPVPPWEFRKPR